VNVGSKSRALSTAQKPNRPFEMSYNQTRSKEGSKEVSSRRTKSQMMTKMKSYMNATGPGDYELPNLWASVLTVSNLKNAPLYSMGQHCKPAIISKHHIQDIIGKSKYCF
jgi:hypothetical protein